MDGNIKLNLFTCHFECGHEERQKELDFCFQTNKDSGYFKEIINFSDRPKYNDFFNATKDYPDDVNIFANADIYFGGTNLIIHVIDIQDNARFDESIDYLMKILKHFDEKNASVPLIIAFHKFDPDRINDKQLIEDTRTLTNRLLELKELQMMFLQSSIYNVYSIVDLISAALSIIRGE